MNHQNKRTGSQTFGQSSTASKKSKHERYFSAGASHQEDMAHGVFQHGRHHNYQESTSQSQQWTEPVTMEHLRTSGSQALSKEMGNYAMTGRPDMYPHSVSAGTVQSTYQGYPYEHHRGPAPPPGPIMDVRQYYRDLEKTYTDRMLD
ncbi:hypothetical protein CBS101457_005638 [Exobasidium rhododendri]|nr:hypothetical protein CBS101457_005638 [Exobasidium rhododendri]